MLGAINDDDDFFTARDNYRWGNLLYESIRQLAHLSRLVTETAAWNLLTC